MWHGYLVVAVPEAEWWATVAPDNFRSIRLLKRLGYVERASKSISDDIAPQSYDKGDRCFTLRVGTREAFALKDDIKRHHR